MSKVESFYQNQDVESQQGSRIQTVTLFPKSAEFDHTWHGVLQDIQDLGIESVQDVKVGRVFLQVSNPELDSIRHAIATISIPVSEGKRVQTAQMILLYGDITTEERQRIEDMMVNVSIQEGLRTAPKQLAIEATENDEVQSVPLSDLSDRDLVELSEARRLFLNLEEMKAVRNYFRTMGRTPTDCELEVIAQAWSEHCGHKTFEAEVVMNGEGRFYARESVLVVLKTAVRLPSVMSTMKASLQKYLPTIQMVRLMPLQVLPTHQVVSWE